MPTLVACSRRYVEAMQPNRVPTRFGPAIRLRRAKSQWDQGLLATPQAEMCPRTANSGQARLAHLPRGEDVDVLARAQEPQQLGVLRPLDVDVPAWVERAAGLEDEAGAHR